MRELLNVLVADDERTIREGLRSCLPWERLNFRLVDCVSNGEKALALFETQQIDLLITDIEMPKLGGLDLIEALLSRGYKPAVLIISGYDNFQYAKRAIGFSIVADYILKPVNMGHLVAQLDKMADAYCSSQTAISLPGIGSLDFDRWVAGSHLNNFDLFSLVRTHILNGEGELCAKAITESWQELVSMRAPSNFLCRYCANYAMRLTNLLVEHCMVSTNVFGDEDPVKTIAAMNSAQLLECILSWTDKLCDLLAHQQDCKKSALIAKSVQLIHARYLSPDFSLLWLAAQLNISPNYLSAKFKDEVGVPFTRYINELRIAYAQSLLKDVNLKIYEVADKVGIEDCRYFAKLFREIVGCTPAEYRNRRQGHS